MKAQPAQLLAVFADAYGPGLDPARAAGAVEALLAEQARLAAVPSEDMIRARRLSNVTAPVFVRARRELGVSRDQLLSADRSDGWLMEQRDTMVVWLLDAGLSVRAVGALLNRERSTVREAAKRARVRLAAVESPPAMRAAR